MIDWPDVPFTADMLKNPDGVIVLCKNADDAEELQKVVLSNSNIRSNRRTLKELFIMSMKKYPDENVCFDFHDKSLAVPGGWMNEVEYCYASFFTTRDQYTNRVKAIFCSRHEPENEISDAEFEMIVSGKFQ